MIPHLSERALILAPQGRDAKVAASMLAEKGFASVSCTSVAQMIESDTFRSFEVYFTITLFYFVMSCLMMQGFGLISRRYFSYPVK